MISPARFYRYWPLAVIAAVSLAIMVRLLSTPDVVVFREPQVWGFINWAHRFPILLDQFRSVFVHGTLYPRWLPELMGGNGYPTFIFYQPGAFFFALPFAILVSDTVLATKLFLLASLLAGGAGAYKMARHFTGRIGATAAAVLFISNPYLLANLYIRGAYSEFLAMLICPWCGYFLFLLYRQWHTQSIALRSAIGMMLSLTALGATHPFVSLYFAPVIVCLAIGMWIDGGKRAWKLMLVFALCGASAAVIATPYLLTVLQMRGEINYQGIDFILLKWLMPFGRIITAYPVCTIIMIAGFWYKRRFATTWGLAISWLWLMFVQSEHAHGLWEHFSPLRMTQLPYRALSADAFIRLAGCALFFGVLDGKLQAQKRLHALLITALTISCLANAVWEPIRLPEARQPLPLSEIAERLVDADHKLYRLRMSKRYDDQSLQYDFIPRRVNIEQLGKEQPFSRPMAWSDESSSLTIHTLEGYPPYDIEFRVTVEKAPAVLHLRQFYFTGWRLRVNGETIGDDHKTISWGADDDARIQVSFAEPGEYSLHAEYAGPPYWWLRNIVMLLLLGAIGFMIQRLIRNTPAQ